MGTRIFVDTRTSGWYQLSPDDPTHPRTLRRMREIASAEARRWQHRRSVTVSAIDTASGSTVLELTRQTRTHCATCTCRTL